MRYLLFVLIAICLTSSVYAEVELWTTSTTIDANTVDVNLYARATAGDLTQVDQVQWALAYKEAENIPSTALQYDFASDWGPQITLQAVAIGSYDHIISWIAVGGANKTITSAAGGTLLATVRFSKAGSQWGSVHIVSEAEDSNWGCYIYNNNVKQVLLYPSEDTSLPVELSSFHANWKNGHIFLTWTTQSEIENLGFNIYRSETSDGPYERINGELIRGAGTTTNAQTYTFVDNRIEPNKTYYYKLEDVSIQGRSRFHGPIEVFVEMAQVPDAFNLEQNYPNPFNPFTTISYAVPEESHVRIQIFNMRGQLVKELVNATLQAGYYEQVWNATDEEGRKLPSGIYICKFEAGSNRFIKKMAYTK